LWMFSQIKLSSSTPNWRKSQCSLYFTTVRVVCLQRHLLVIWGPHPGALRYDFRLK
jgi:hypothetical protein